MAAQQPTQDASAPTDPTQNPQAATAEEEDPSHLVPLVDPRLPTRKDSSLRDFIAKIDDYAPIIPEGVTAYYMTRAGLPPPPQTDPRLAKLLALATQKFIADIAADAYQYARIRASNSSAANNNPMAAAGLPVPGAPAVPPGAAGAAKGVGGAAGGAGAGGANAPGQQLLGVQRAGYGGGGQGGSQNRTVLGMEDLGMAVGEYGVNVKRSEFYR